MKSKYTEAELKILNNVAKIMTAEIDRVEDVFAKLPEEFRADCAADWILEIVIQGARNHFQGLGIFDDVKERFREGSIQAMEEGADQPNIYLPGHQSRGK